MMSLWAWHGGIPLYPNSSHCLAAREAWSNQGSLIYLGALLKVALDF